MEFHSLRVIVKALRAFDYRLDIERCHRNFGRLVRSVNYQKPLVVGVRDAIASRLPLARRQPSGEAVADVGYRVNRKRSTARPSIYHVPTRQHPRGFWLTPRTESKAPTDGCLLHGS